MHRRGLAAASRRSRPRRQRWLRRVWAGQGRTSSKCRRCSCRRCCRWLSRILLFWQIHLWRAWSLQGVGLRDPEATLSPGVPSLAASRPRLLAEDCCLSSSMRCPRHQPFSTLRHVQVLDSGPHVIRQVFCQLPVRLTAAFCGSSLKVFVRKGFDASTRTPHMPGPACLALSCGCSHLRHACLPDCSGCTLCG